MARKQPSAEEREAIWRAHECKCAYTTEILSLGTLHIDHILPQSLEKNPVIKSEILSKFNLPSDFNIHGYENLLPCQPRANLQKGDDISSSTGFWLDIAAKKKSSVEKHLISIQRRKNKGLHLNHLQQAIERGDLNAAEVINSLQYSPENCKSDQEFMGEKKLPNSSLSHQIDIQAKLTNQMKFWDGMPELRSDKERVHQALEYAKRAEKLLGYIE